MGRGTYLRRTYQHKIRGGAGVENQESLLRDIYSKLKNTGMTSAALMARQKV